MRRKVIELLLRWANYGWVSCSESLPELYHRVDIWMNIYPSPMSMGIGDAFRVNECWREDSGWWHIDGFEKKQLAADYITHWSEIRRPE